MERLKAARGRAGWSQQEGTGRLGVSRAYYSQVESGARPLTAELALRAVECLEVSPVLLPLPALSARLEPLAPDELASALGRLGYERFCAPAGGVAESGLASGCGFGAW